MKLLDVLFLHYAHKTAKSVAALRKTSRSRRRAKPVRPVPFEATVHVRVPLGEEDSLDSVLQDIHIDVPPGVTIDSIDIDAEIITDPEDNVCCKRPLSASAPPPPARPARPPAESYDPLTEWMDERREHTLSYMENLERFLRKHSQTELECFMESHTQEELEQFLESQ